MKEHRRVFKSVSIVILQVGLALLALPSLSLGQFYYGPVSSAMGESGRAAINASECVYLNPACVAHYRGYEISVSGKKSSLLGGEKHSDVGFSLSDNRGATFLPASFAYLKRSKETSGGDKINETDYHLSLAGFPIPKLAFGLGYRYLIHDSGETERQHRGHLGLLYTPIHNLGVGLVGKNIFQLNGQKGESEGSVRKSWALGLHYLHTESWRLSLDGIFYPDLQGGKNTQLGGGIETWLNDFLIFRLGFLRNEVVGTGQWAAGWGMSLPRFHMNYSYQKNQSQGMGEAHGIDIKIPF